MIKNLFHVIFTIAEGYGHTLTDEQVEEIAEQVDDDFTIEEIEDGVKEYVSYL